MRAHHFSAGSLCPRGRRLLEGRGGLRERTALVCHCVLLDLGPRLVLVDTGLGMRDVEDPERLARSMRAALHPDVDPSRTAVAHVLALGVDPRDVTDVVVTHLDFDHAGGLSDFPHARVHVYAPEHAAAMERGARMGRRRYRPRQWAHGPDWRLYETRGDAWLGFEAVRDLEGLPPEILIVPLVGHTPGHAGVAFRDGERWSLHAGDAYFFHGEVEPRARDCPRGLRLYQTLMESNREARLGNQDRLRKLVLDHRGAVDVFCSHDPFDLERMPRVPAHRAARGVSSAAR
jgi:glyoxylase-like metal-dependent hydrolase (beta-lactamase superfamily II)